MSCMREKLNVLVVPDVTRDDRMVWQMLSSERVNTPVEEGLLKKVLGTLVEEGLLKKVLSIPLLREVRTRQLP